MNPLAGMISELIRSVRQPGGHALLALSLPIAMLAFGSLVHLAGNAQTKFQRVPAQFIAALGDPTASSGNGAQSWGLWPVDPGPRGVRLNNFDQLKKAGGVAPDRWRFDGADWWLEEHGLIMEQPQFPLPVRKYLVTGDRETRAVLTIHAPDKNGDRRWELDGGANLYDVTHLACRAARYRPATAGGSCSPASAQQTAFPVAPGAVMPPVAGCRQQDYAVLIVIGVSVGD
jgi:hypothetical protein